MSLEWRIALRNLFRNKRRNLIAGGAVAFSCAGLILLGSYLVRTEHYLQVNSVYINHVGHFSIYKNGGLERHLTRPKRYSLSLEDQNRLLEILKTFPEVEFVGKYLMGVGLASNGCQSAPFLASGVEPGTEARIRAHPEVREWTPELAKTQRGRPISSESEISLTDSLARRLGKEMVADEAAGSAPTGVLNCEDAKTRKENSRYADLQLMSRSFAGDFAAVDASIVSHHSTGLFFSEDTGLVLPLSLLQKLYDTDRVTYLGVFLKDPGQAKVFFPRLNQALQTSGLDLLLLPYWDERVSLFYVGVMSFLFTMATFFYILVLGMIAVTITNFVTLGKGGYYENLTFHRVIPGFMIQGGDPTGNGTGGKSVFGTMFEDEIKADSALYQTGYKAGVIAMANRGPNTNGSQFFIMDKDYPLPPNYTIFGHVTAGQDIVSAIASVDRDPTNDMPKQKVTFKVTVKN